MRGRPRRRGGRGAPSGRGRRPAGRAGAGRSWGGGDGMPDMAWVVAVAALALLGGLLRIAGGGRLRRRFGLGEGRTVALDNVTLTSRRLGLTCRPDRLVRTGGTIIPEEWKKALKV